MHQLRMSPLRPFSGWTKIPSSLPDFFFFFPPLLYPKIFPRPTFHLPPPVLPTTYLPPSPSLHRQSSWLQRCWAGASLELGAGLERERAWNLERAWSLERLQLDPRRTQVSISLCVASSLCCKKRRRRRRRWHCLLLLLCAVELATRSLLQRKLRSFGASPELAFLSCSKLRAPESSGACRAPDRSKACYSKLRAPESSGARVARIGPSSGFLQQSWPRFELVFELWEVCIFTSLRSFWKFRTCGVAEGHFWQLQWSYTLFLQEPPLKQPIFPVHLWYGFTISAVVSKISPLLCLISFMLLRASSFLCDQTRWSLQLILHVFSWFLLAGKLVEEEEGSFAVWLSYLVTGVGANVVSWLVLPRSVVSAGASGAVFGLFAVSVLVKVCHSTH